MTLPDMEIPDGEFWPCFVGSGECRTPAKFQIDDGSGNYAYICAAHRIEFDKMEKLFDEMTAEKRQALSEAIKANE